MKQHYWWQTILMIISVLHTHVGMTSTAAPRRRGREGDRFQPSASGSPCYGEQSVFAHKLVSIDATNGVRLHNVMDSFPSMRYTLNMLTNTDTDDVGVEDSAKRWIESLQAIQDSGLKVLKASCALPKLSAFCGFCSTDMITPDVTVTSEADFPVFTVEVFSSTYLSTIKKALINAIEQCRIWRAYDDDPSSVPTTVAYVFPRNKESTCVCKIEVKFVLDSVLCRFSYTLQPVSMTQVATDIGTTVEQWRQKAEDAERYTLVFPYYIGLSQNECDTFEINGSLVQSSRSLIIRNSNSTKYWKCSFDSTGTFLRLATRHIVQAVRLEYNLLPQEEHTRDARTFFVYEGLQAPLCRERAKECLVPLLQGVKTALDELHRHGYAHMDVRLPNICFTRSGRVMLIDLDRCERSLDVVKADSLYGSDMYRAPATQWVNYQVDWRALGMLICFVLDHVQHKDYHIMLSQNKVSNEVLSMRFVKCLLEEGRWDEAKWNDFTTSPLLHDSHSSTYYHNVPA